MITLVWSSGCHLIQPPSQSRASFKAQLLRAFSFEDLQVPQRFHNFFAEPLPVLSQPCSALSFLLEAFPAEKILILGWEIKINCSLANVVSLCRRTKSLLNSERVAAWTIPSFPSPPTYSADGPWHHFSASSST